MPMRSWTEHPSEQESNDLRHSPEIDFARGVGSEDLFMDGRCEGPPPTVARFERCSIEPSLFFGGELQLVEQ